MVKLQPCLKIKESVRKEKTEKIIRIVIDSDPRLLTLSVPQDICSLTLSLSGEKRHKTFVTS